MKDARHTFSATLIDWLAIRWVEIRAALAIPLEKTPHAEQHIDPDLKRWVAGSPMVTHSPTSRYGKSAFGCLSRDGRDVFDIGPAEKLDRRS